MKLASLALVITISVAQSAAQLVYEIGKFNDAVIERLLKQTEYTLSTLPTCIVSGTPNKNGDIKVIEMNRTKTESLNNLIDKNLTLIETLLDFSVLQVVAVSEKQETVTFALRITVSWTDCRLAWNPAEYYDSRFVAISPSRFRKLDMFVPEPRLLEEIDSSASQNSEKIIEIEYTGLIRISKEFTTTVSCNFDVSMYPFDTQACNLTFEMQQNTLIASLLNAVTDTNVNKLAKRLLGDGRFMPSDTWEIVVLPAVKESVTLVESCSKMIRSMRYCSFDRLTYTVILHRYPTYQLVNLMLPAVLVVMISSCVFLIPHGSGDKMGLSLTILLSMFVFTQLMYEKLPETGSTIPLISQFYIMCIILVSSSCIFSAIMTTAASSDQSVPTLLQRLAEFTSPFLLCRDYRKRRCVAKTSSSPSHTAVYTHASGENAGDPDPDLDPDTDNANPNPNVNVKVNEFGNNGISNGSGGNNGGYEAMKWSELAPLIDRIFFGIHFVMSTTLFVTYISYGYYPWKNHYSGKLPNELFGLRDAMVKLQQQQQQNH